MTRSMTLASYPRLALTPLAAALLLASLDALAFQAGVPNAGTILQQVQPALPAAPPSGRPTLQLAPSPAPGMPASAPFEVRTIRIIGNSAFPAATLHALVADAERDGGGHDGAPLFLDDSWRI